MEFLLTPYPAHLRAGEGFLKGKLKAELPPEKDPLLLTASELIGLDGSVPVKFYPSADFPEADAFMSDEEGYALRVAPSGVSIYASTCAGWFYGAITLSQLVRQFGETLPCVEIFDKPLWRHRGAQVSYGQMNVAYRRDYLMRFIRKMAALKINHVYLYLEWRFAFPSIPATHQPSYITPEDAREMIAYAKRFHITLVPELNVMGHSSDFLGAEIFADLREYPADGDPLTGPAGVLCPSNPRVRELVALALSDLMDVFDSPVIHVGGDEVGDLGICPTCSVKKEQMGNAGIYLEYFLWVRDVLQKRGRLMGVWSDMMAHYAGLNPYYKNEETLIPTERFLELRNGTVIYDWSYDGPAKESIDSFCDNGFTVICSTSVHGCSTAAPWLGQIKNQADYFKDGFREGVIGGLATDWIYGYGYHGEEMGALYASAEAFMWQGVEDGFARGVSRDCFERAAALQYYGAGPELAEFWHLAGDPDKGALRFFPGSKNGSYLRKIAYLSDNPLKFYCKYAPFLRGKREEFHKEITNLERLFKAAASSVPEAEREWFRFSSCSLVLYRYLYEKFRWAEEFHENYRRAALTQYEDAALFEKLLADAADGLRQFDHVFEEPAAFLTDANRLLGLETGSVDRLRETERKLRLLADYVWSLRDGHRPAPSIQNLSDWLFDRPGTGFWSPRSDEWNAEPFSYRQLETEDGTEWGLARW